MISGVLGILIGQALVLRSAPHAACAAVFMLINAIYIPAVEEPMLAARFGEPYREYTHAVRSPGIVGPGSVRQCSTTSTLRRDSVLSHPVGP